MPAQHVNAVLRKHHNILQQSEQLKSVFTEPPCVTHRRAQNRRDLLMSSKSVRSKPIGCRPCNKPRCKVCQHMTTSLIAKSTASNFSVKMNGDYNCDTRNVVYLLECSICGMQYVGETETPFRYRFNNHKAHISSLPHLQAC